MIGLRRWLKNRSVIRYVFCWLKTNANDFQEVAARVLRRGRVLRQWQVAQNREHSARCGGGRLAVGQTTHGLFAAASTSGSNTRAHDQLGEIGHTLGGGMRNGFIGNGVANTNVHDRSSYAANLVANANDCQ
jgi:hypothetical protein